MNDTGKEALREKCRGLPPWPIALEYSKIVFHVLICDLQSNDSGGTPGHRFHFFGICSPVSTEMA